MAAPPKQMRKGFDDALALAMRTSKQVLFVDYVKIRPEDADALWAVGKHLPWQSPDWDRMSPQEQIQHLMPLLPDHALKDLVSMAVRFADSYQQKQFLESRGFFKSGRR